MSEDSGTAQEEENIEVMEMKITRSIRMIERGEIKVAKTRMPLKYLKLYGWRRFVHKSGINHI